MNDKEKWLELRNCISMGGGIQKEDTQWVFDMALKGIELQEEVVKLRVESGRRESLLMKIRELSEEE